MGYNINFPDRNGTSGQETINTENNIVLIGANGSGKTRFGVRIEELTQGIHTVHWFTFLDSTLNYLSI